MKLSSIAAQALMIAGVAVGQSISLEARTVPRAEPVRAVSAPCVDAAWPYLSAECAARAGGRPIRVVRAEGLH